MTRFRDQLRVTPRFKKGTSRARRARVTRIVNALWRVNQEKIETAAHQAMLDQLLYGQGAVRLSWNGETEDVEVSALPASMYRAWSDYRNGT